MTARVALVALLLQLPQTIPAQSIVTLRPGQTVERTLAGGGQHTYPISLRAGEFVHLIVDQRGIDVEVAFVGPDGKTLATIDSPNGARGLEPLVWIADAAGDFAFQIRSLEKTAPEGKYAATLAKLRLAEAIDRDRLAAQSAFVDAQKQPSNAIARFEEALRLWRAVEDREREAMVCGMLATKYLEAGDSKKALGAMETLRASQHAAGDRAEAVTLTRMASVHDSLGDPKAAVEANQQALPMHIAAGNRMWEAITRHNLGTEYDDLGDRSRALESLEAARGIFQALGMLAQQAASLHQIGKVEENLGRHQDALNHFTQALDLNRRARNTRGEAVTLEDIGNVYYNLDDNQRALSFWLEALPKLKAAGDRRELAATLNNIGELYRYRGEYAKAIENLTEALTLSRASGDRRRQADALSRLGSAYVANGDPAKGIEQLKEALALRRAIPDPQGEGDTLVKLGRVLGALHQPAEAAKSFGAALPIFRAIGYLPGEAAALEGMARAERDQDQLTEAREHIEASLGAIESLRSSVLSSELRARYLGSKQSYYELYIDILMRLHRRSPAERFDQAAWAASERGRARSLMEMLAEARVDIRQGVDLKLLQEDEELHRLLAGKADSWTRLMNRPHSKKQGDDAAADFAELTARHQEVESRIRQSSPRYAALMQPQPVALADVQDQGLDAGTLLLEYSLGEERSYLWVISKTSLEAHELPPRAEIERDSRTALQQITADRPTAPAFARLGEVLLGPVKNRLERQRLIIVGDGALLYLPFGALPVPGNNRALLARHEVISLPSASVLPGLREFTKRRPQRGTIMIFADPVFDAEDSRTQAQRGPNPSTGMKLRRLPFTRQEAAAITALVPRDRSRVALDFEASRETALSAETARYRILHFATHTVLDSERPELSGIALSMVDREGRPRDGFLRLLDLYNLRLGADLVVLSACQTALGLEIRGEGLTGLTRGFMYAGAPRVLASLWKVDDRATAELMKLFYQNVLEKRLTPAAALRSAQLALSANPRWSAPYFWAAFILQGDWR